MKISRLVVLSIFVLSAASAAHALDVDPACRYVPPYRGSHTSGGTCLIPTTTISTPSGDRQISDLKVGDEVFSFDPSKNRLTKSRITALYRHDSVKRSPHDDLNSRGRYTVCELKLANGNNVYATPSHRFYTATNNGTWWSRIGDVLSTSKAVDSLEAPSTVDRVLQMQSTKSDQQYAPYLDWSQTVSFGFPRDAEAVYNIEVTPFHNYFANGVLVHNVK